MNTEFTEAASTFPDPFRLLVRETSPSTNDELHTLAKQGHAHGLVLLALEQTSGRGRRGNVWHASPGDSLAFSVLLRPTEPKALWPRLALATGLALALACEDFRQNVAIKWPNDIHLHGRKLAGILVEAGADYAIVGIGININTAHFPAEIADIATSLHRESGTTHNRADFLAAFIHHFARLHTRIGSDFPEVIAAVRQRCLLTGKRVTLTTPNGPLTGTVEGISATGSLLLRQGDTLHTILQADEIRPH